MMFSAAKYCTLIKWSLYNNNKIENVRLNTLFDATAKNCFYIYLVIGTICFKAKLTTYRHNCSESLLVPLLLELFPP